MLNIEKVQKYTNYFSDNQIEFYKLVHGKNENGILISGYYHYDLGVEQFMKDFYESNLVDYNYQEQLDQYVSELSNPTELIEVANLDLLKAILTYYVRQERFCDGTWAHAIEQKIFLKTLLNIIERYGHLI